MAPEGDSFPDGSPSISVLPLSRRVNASATGKAIPWKEGKEQGALPLTQRRKCRYLIAVKLTDKKASTMTTQSITLFRRMPRRLRHTLTVDNGKEFSRFKELEAKTGLKVYFADPYAAWQRGTNENTNGLLRYYFPKGTDFRTVSEKEVALVVLAAKGMPS